MKNTIAKIIITLSLLFTSLNASAEIDPKAKAVGTMALYGTVGGTLLGTASLAFGTKARAVAIGASVGLYMGLIFGGYVVGTHALKSKGYFQQKNDNYYPDTQSSPYEDSFNQQGNPNEGVMYMEKAPNIELDELNNNDLAPKDFQLQGQTYYVELLNIRF